MVTDAMTLDLLEGSLQLNPNRSGGLDLWSLYSSVLELGERLLADVAAGDRSAAAWAYAVMQEQIPSLRRLAENLAGPIPEPFLDREAEVRAKYAIPTPLQAV